MKKLIHAELLELRMKPEELGSTIRHPVSLMLHNVRSLYNVGSLFRTADSALISELILCGFTPYPPRKEIEKTALGAVDTVPWKYFQKTQQAVEYMKDKGYSVAALELTDSSIDYNNISMNNFPLCIIAGNEITGIDNDILNICDFAIDIPMYGVKHSLNVSVASGIAIYNSIRIWNNLNTHNHKICYEKI